MFCSCLMSWGERAMMRSMITDRSVDRMVSCACDDMDASEAHSSSVSSAISATMPRSMSPAAVICSMPELCPRLRSMSATRCSYWLKRRVNILGVAPLPQRGASAASMKRSWVITLRTTGDADTIMESSDMMRNRLSSGNVSDSFINAAMASAASDTRRQSTAMSHGRYPESSWRSISVFMRSMAASRKSASSGAGHTDMYPLWERCLGATCWTTLVYMARLYSFIGIRVNTVLLNFTTSAELRQLVFCSTVSPDTATRSNSRLTRSLSREGSELRKRYIHCFSSPMMRLSWSWEWLSLTRGVRLSHCISDVS